MDFNALSTQNWSRMFNVWIEDIQIIGLPAAMTPFVLQHRVLPKVRVFARYASAFVILLFALHCSSPRSAASTPNRGKPAGTAAKGTASPGGSPPVGRSTSPPP